METAEKKSKIQAVSRAIDILRCFDGRKELGITEISKAVGLHKSTAAGLVSTLCAERMLEQNEVNGKYRLGLELFRLGKNVNTDLHELCHPYLLDLSEAVGETVNMAMLDGDAVVYIDKIDSPRSMRIVSRIGQRIPFYCTANGKALIARQPKDVIDALLADFKPQIYTEKTIKTADEMRRVLSKSLEDGYACDDEEYETGLICYSVPIVKHEGQPDLAISVSGPAGRMQGEFRERVLENLKATAEKISRAVRDYM